MCREHQTWDLDEEGGCKKRSERRNRRGDRARVRDRKANSPKSNAKRRLKAKTEGAGKADDWGETDSMGGLSMEGQ